MKTLEEKRKVRGGKESHRGRGGREKLCHEHMNDLIIQRWSLQWKCKSSHQFRDFPKITGIIMVWGGGLWPPLVVPYGLGKLTGQ